MNYKTIIFPTLILLYSSACFALEISQPKVYTTDKKSNKNIELEYFILGKRSDLMLLAHIFAPGYSEDGKRAVYKGNCETSKCNKITYKVLGGQARNIVTENYGSKLHTQVMLSEENSPISLSIDKSKTEDISEEYFLKKYYQAVGRMESGIPSKSSLLDSEKEGIDSFKKNCGNKIEIRYDTNKFEALELSNLLGMSQYYLTEISKACSDEMYKEELEKIDIVELIPSKIKKAIALIDSKKLLIYLSSDSYNPVGEAKLWLESL